AGRDSDRDLRDQRHQPRAAPDAADLAVAAVPAPALYRVESTWRSAGLDAVQRQARKPRRLVRLPALRNRGVGAALTAAADRRASGLPAISPEPKHEEPRGMVDRPARHRSGLDRARRPETARGRLPGVLCTSSWHVGGRRPAADADVLRR